MSVGVRRSLWGGLKEKGGWLEKVAWNNEVAGGEWIQCIYFSSERVLEFMSGRR